MSAFNVMICDDEEPAHVVLRNYCAQIPWISDVYEAYDGMEAYGMLQRKKVDILLLDIEMPGMKGLELAQQLENPPIIILTTAYPEYALDGYRIDALDYLLKPISTARFLEAMNRAKERLAQKKEGAKKANELWVRVDKVDRKLSPHDLIWVEAEGDYLRLQISGEEKRWMIHQRLGQFVEQCAAFGLMQIHRSVAINWNHIEAIEGNQVRIGGQAFPIGKTYREAVQAKLRG